MQTCDLLIKDGSLLIKYDQLEEHVDMAVSGGRILETGKELWKKYQAVETINGKGKLFMPGLIDSHMHTGQQLLKGLVLDAKPIIWTRIMLPFESTLTPDKMRYGRIHRRGQLPYGDSGFCLRGKRPSRRTVLFHHG